MANTIIAGNATNNGLAFSSDSTGALNILTGSGAGTAAISIDASQNVTMAANLSVTGNTTVTGTLSATNGITGSLKSATAQNSTSGTSIDFTGIPSGVKRITVMFNGVSTSGTSNLQLQIGSGSVTTTGYTSGFAYINTTSANSGTLTTGIAQITTVSAATNYNASFVLTNITGNTWVSSGVYGASTSGFGGTTTGSIALSGVLDRVRCTTVNGTDTFDAGSINIIYE